MDEPNHWSWSLSNPNVFQNLGDSDFRNWQPGQPDNRNSPEDCVRIYDDGLWNDWPCEKYEKSVCANVNGEDPTCPPNSPFWTSSSPPGEDLVPASDFHILPLRRIHFLWVLVSGPDVTFVLVENFFPWAEALANCRQHHTDMAIARNPSENEKIKQVMPPGQFAWIGLNRNSLTWVDGTSPTFTHWRSGEPNNEDEKCTVANFEDSGKWEDCPCDWKFPFFCYGGEF